MHEKSTLYGIFSEISPSEAPESVISAPCGAPETCAKLLQNGNNRKKTYRPGFKRRRRKLLKTLLKVFKTRAYKCVIPQPRKLRDCLKSVFSPFRRGREMLQNIAVFALKMAAPLQSPLYGSRQAAKRGYKSWLQNGNGRLSDS